MYRSLIIAALLGGVIGGSLWSIVDSSRQSTIPVKEPLKPVDLGAERALALEANEEMRVCVDALNERMDTHDSLRNEVVVSRARLAAAQHAPEAQPAQPVTWSGEPDRPETYTTGLLAALASAQGRLLLSACDEFPCVFGLEIPHEEVEAFENDLTIPGAGALYVKRLGIADEGGVIQYFGVASSSSPELEAQEDAVALRFEYRSLLLDNAYRAEVKP